MRRSYVDTAHGQLHLRSLGAGERALLLVHWTPLSGRMFEGVAQHFAGGGYRVLAPDLLGYGRSDARPESWSIEAWADNLAEMLDALAVERVSVLGGHIGAAIALELALRHPERVGAVILDGCPLMTPELRAALKTLGEWKPPASGQGVFDRTVGLLSEYIPGYTAAGEGLTHLWPAMIDYLETGFVPSAPVAAAYDIAERLPKLRQPALLFGAEKDSLAGTFDEAMRLLCPEEHHLFAGHHPLHFPERHSEYVARVLDFLSFL